MSPYKSRRDLMRLAAATPIAGLFLPSCFAETQIKPDEKLSTPDFVSAVQQRVRLGLDQGESVGLAVAVVSGTEIVWEGGFGWAHRDNQLRVTPHSPFSLQSLTKPFSTTLVTTFAAEGRLALDQPANRYLKGVKLQRGNGDPEKVTVRLLGAHVSGLPRTYAELYDGMPSPSPSSFLNNYGRLAYPPGQIWEYSNIGFEALGGILADLTGADYGTLMLQRVLAPLGMHNSFWDTDKTRVSGGVVRYDAAGMPVPFYVTTTPPSGELYASAHDIARFAIWNMKLPLSGSVLMNDRWIDELHKPVFIGPSGATSTFGWALDRLQSGETVIHKGGGGTGVSTILCMVPERKTACVVLANKQFAEKLIHDVCNEVLSSYLPAWKMPDENGEPPRVPFKMSDSLAGLWRGVLVNDGVELPVHLHIQASDTATLAIGSHTPEAVTNLQSEGSALLGLAPGGVDSPDAKRIGATAVRFKVIPSGNRLIGRITAQAGPLNEPLATLSFVVNLGRE